MHWDLIGAFARSQQDYPKGIGVKHSLFVKRNVLGEKELTDCSRMELNKLVVELRNEYFLIKRKQERLKNANVSK